MFCISCQKTTNTNSNTSVSNIGTSPTIANQIKFCIIEEKYLKLSQIFCLAKQIDLFFKNPSIQCDLWGIDIPDTLDFYLSIDQCMNCKIHACKKL